MVCLGLHVFIMKNVEYKKNKKKTLLMFYNICKFTLHWVFRVIHKLWDFYTVMKT